MGNKLCKKKADPVDNPKSPTPFDRIITRLHLRPNSWKSDSHLNQKQVNRCSKPTDPKTQIQHTQLLSKSSDWTDVALEVPDGDEAIHLRNPKLALIFDDGSTPTPPPRKLKKGFREKIEAVAKTGLQAFQNKKPVEEPLCVKKVVKATCPVDDHDCAIHNRNHRHPPKNETNDAKKDAEEAKLATKEAKRRKNLSVVSLPNYNELKLTVATFDDIDNKPKSSEGSLPEAKGKLETCMTRCRSFGSLLPQQLLGKLRVRKTPTDIESDDSFGGLEDWDLRIIEHYNPKDTSLPRPRPKTDRNVLSDVENLIVKDEDLEKEEKPKVPARRSESLLKKINREASECATRLSREVSKSPNLSITPPPSPERKEEVEERVIRADQLPTEEDGRVEHSSLMKILEEFSIKDKQRELATAPSGELRKQINSVEDFLHNEKMGTNIQSAQYGNIMAKT